MAKTVRPAREVVQRAREESKPFDDYDQKRLALRREIEAGLRSRPPAPVNVEAIIAERRARRR